MDAEQFAAYRHEAVHQLMELNEGCEKTHRISSWPRWDYNFDAGTLTFSENGVPRVIATIQVIGSTSISGGTWMWAWANESLPAKVTEAVRRVRAFGQAENLAQLTQECLPDDEYLGWGMSAVAAKILRSKGAYRCPGENGFVYVVYSSLRFADEEPATPADGPKQIECVSMGLGLLPMFASIWWPIPPRNGFREIRTIPTSGQMLGVLSATPSFRRKANGTRKTKQNSR
jgi:hypothetical protein